MMNTDKLCEVDFKSINSPRAAYWFGFLVGDGSIGIYGGGRHRLKLSIQKADIGHLRKFANLLGYDNNRVHTYGNMSEIRINDKELVSNLFNLGLCQNKAKKTSRKLIPRKYCKDFIRGLFDADGTIVFFKPREGKIKTADFHINGTHDLLEGVREVFSKEIDGITIETGCITKSKGCYVLKYKGRWLVDKIGRYLLSEADVYLERKYLIFQKLFEYNNCTSRKNARFNKEIISKIRRMYLDSKTQNEIAKKFEVSQPHISRILNKKRYPNL